MVAFKPADVVIRQEESKFRSASRITDDDSYTITIKSID